jgi:hypothetical protein
MMKKCDENIRRTLDLVDRMTEIADDGDMDREDSACGVLYGVLRDSAYKIKKLAEAERDAHIRKGWWRDEGKPAPPVSDPTARQGGRTEGRAQAGR